MRSVMPRDSAALALLPRVSLRLMIMRSPERGVQRFLHDCAACLGGFERGRWCPWTTSSVVSAGSLDAVLQLADVARPVVAAQHVDRGCRYSADVLVGRPSFLDEEVREIEDVRAAFAQRRNESEIRLR